MADIKVNLNQIEVKKLDLPSKCLHLAFKYSTNSGEGSFEKKFIFGESLIAFSVQLLHELKEKIKSEYPAGMANVFFGNERENALAKDKIVNGMEKILRRIVELKKIQEHQQYIKEFGMVNAMKVNLV